MMAMLDGCRVRASVKLQYAGLRDDISPLCWLAEMLLICAETRFAFTSSDWPIAALPAQMRA